MSTADTDDEMRRWYNTHRSTMLAYAYKLTQNIDDAEDVVQEAMIRAWRHREKIRTLGSSTRAWLATTVRNVVIDEMRKRDCRPRTLELDLADSVAETLHERAAVVYQHEARLDNEITVRTLLTTLPPPQRDALVQVYVHDRTMLQAANRTGVSVSTLKSRVSYALTSLRREVRHRSAA